MEGNDPEKAEGRKTAVDERAKKNLKVRALMFARARELAGVSDVDLVVPEGATTAECVAELSAKFPSLQIIRDCIVVALNCNYVTDPVQVKDGDELAIIPPISGG